LPDDWQSKERRNTPPVCLLDAQTSLILPVRSSFSRDTCSVRTSINIHWHVSFPRGHCSIRRARLPVGTSVHLRARDVPWANCGVAWSPSPQGNTGNLILDPAGNSVDRHGVAVAFIHHRGEQRWYIRGVIWEHGGAGGRRWRLYADNQA
jgi:hypothetical protein